MFTKEGAGRALSIEGTSDLLENDRSRLVVHNGDFATAVVETPRGQVCRSFAGDLSNVVDEMVAPTAIDRPTIADLVAIWQPDSVLAVVPRRRRRPNHGVALSHFVQRQVEALALNLYDALDFGVLAVTREALQVTQDWAIDTIRLRRAARPLGP